MHRNRENNQLNTSKQMKRIINAGISRFFILIYGSSTFHMLDKWNYTARAAGLASTFDRKRVIEIRCNVGDMKSEGKLRMPGGNWKNRVIATTLVYIHSTASSCSFVSPNFVDAHIRLYTISNLSFFFLLASPYLFRHPLSISHRSRT